ncbi:hypothetical protein CC1G_00121 [Coprinopsis cinerea okayama7|uniref:Cytochrome P450 n=1 Tax=Coprinopsis cinerea (strain Okayama-7 / 130 / ATCC MYA-4618 / FGSC 9003) TaxID=240176 RepID=A8NWU1_COPC7|nr:hypothetical protein CC1G_00121 [Coprinopsis cinerea okayama7\|eukprot:XP_001836985.2 hypothetical protein CC1G_00121 [Coprinopsis cinerea okayama7\
MQGSERLLSLPLSAPSSQSLKEGAILVAATWAAWRVLKALTSSHPLDKVPGPRAESWFFGCMLQFFNPNAWDFHAEIAKKYPGITRLPSMQGDVMLHIDDPKALYHILVKDQNIFEESEDFIRTNGLVFGPGLLATLGDHHRKQRKLLNPVFSIAHMREMIPTFYDVAYRLRDSFSKLVKDGPSEIDIASWMTRTALELIGQSGLGTSFDSLQQGAAEHPFAASLKGLMQGLSVIPFWRFVVLPKFDGIGSPRFRRWVVERIPSKNIQKLVNMVDVMHNTSLEIYEKKKAALAEDTGSHDEVGSRCKDIIGILMRENMNASGDERMPEHEVLGQMSTLMFAAMDTTSNALCRILHLLSENQHVQDRVRREILEAKEQAGGSDLSYDDLVQLPYLDSVCRETLRLYPPLPVVMRQARQDAIVPLSRPFTSTDGKPTQQVLVPRGTQTIIGIMSCNRNPAIWGPDALEWKPERWLNPLPDTVTSAKVPGIYSHLMTFIGGGRSCIGFKFSQLEMKVVLCCLLESFKFTPTDKKITWLFNGVTQPAVMEPGSTDVPHLQMPLNVSRL